MKDPDLERIRNGMAQGTGEFTVTDSEGNEHNYNISGAASVLRRVYKQVQDYGLVYPDDFPATRDDSTDLVSEEEVDEAQQAMQYFEDEFGSLLASFTGNDGALEDDSGNAVVDLPNAATTAAKSADLPDMK